MNRLGRSVFAVFFVLLGTSFLLSSSPVAKAADLYGSIRGTVSDASGAAVPGADVTAKNIATGVSTHVASSATGAYSFLQLAIGDYTVTATKDGFQTFTANQIHIDLNQVYVQDIPLTLGAISQEVSVQANQVQVETTSPQLGTVITAQQIVDLPLLGRDWINLQALQPGVVGAADRLGVAGSIPDYATNGGQTQFNVFLIDGTDTNDEALNTATIVPSVDALTEFRMVTSTMNPEYARSSGAIMSAAIKSGTNSFHGDAFDFYRDTFLDARNYFSRKVSPFHENLFGGTFGGPIIKNHLFGFFSYQGVRESTPQSNNNVSGGVKTTNVFLNGQATGTTPFPGLSTSAKTSPFPLVGDNGTMYPAGTPYSTIFSAGTVPTVDINSISKGLLSFVPSPNKATVVGGPLNAYTFNSTRSVTDNQYIYRIDDALTTKDTLWGTWMNEKEAFIEPIPFAGATLPGFAESDGESFKLLSLSWTHVINDHMLNELRGGYNRFNYQAVFPATPELPSVAGFSITPQSASGAGLPYISVHGLFALGFSEFGPQPRLENLYEGADNFQWVVGRHTMKFGFDLRRWQDFNPALSTNSGFFNFNTFGTYSTGNAGADFLLGIPAFYTQASGGLENSRTREFYSYAQDDFKLRPNLTVMYGLGWTIDTPVSNIAYNGHGQLAFRPGVQSTVFPNAPVGVVYSGDPGIDAAGPTQWKNFGPRIGVAYSPDWGRLTGGPGRTSIRAGFGIYYDKSGVEEAGQVGFGVPPFSVTTNNGISGGGAALSGINPSFAKPFVDIKTGAAVPNPYPFNGFPSNVNFATTPGLEPVYGLCCASAAPNTTDPRMSNFNVTVERQVTPSTIASVGYVGSISRHLSYGAPSNIVTGLGPGNSLIYPYNLNVYGPIDQIFSGANGNYNALQVSVNKKMSRNLGFLISYTYAHSLDESSGFEDTSFGEGGGGYGGFDALRSTNPYCFPKCDYGSSTYDARHRLVISYTYHIPGVRGDWMVSRLTQGWTLSGITTFQTGVALDVADLSTPSGGCDGFGDFGCWDGPNQVGPAQYENIRSTGYWFNPNSFQQVPCASTVAGCAGSGISPTSVVSYGNARRDPLHAPGINNWDLVLFKDTSITESMKVELRMEAYNMFNHTQFDPNQITTDVSSGTFGQESGALNPRLMQIAAKFIF